MEISVWTCCFDILHHSALFFQPFIYHFFQFGICQLRLLMKSSISAKYLLKVIKKFPSNIEIISKLSSTDWQKYTFFCSSFHSITLSLVTDRHLFGKIKYCTYLHDPISFNMIRSKADDSWRVLVIFGRQL